MITYWSKEQKGLQLMSYLLWVLSKGELRVTPKELRSVDESKPLNSRIIEILESEEYIKHFEFFEKCVEFIDDIRNPFGIYKFIKEYAKAHGKQHTKIINIVNNKTGETSTREVDDYYEPDDPDEYVIIIVDHMALLGTEGNGNIRDSMIKLSSDYFVTLRNKYKYIPVAVVQQAMSQESNENFKLNRLRPSLDGIGDAKVIARDADTIIGLYAPHRYNLPEYLGYNINLFQDNIRFMEIIAGREGGGGSTCPLYFDGGVNYFEELPLPKDVIGMNSILSRLKRIRSGFSFFIFSKKPKKKLFNIIKSKVKIWLIV